MARHVSFTPMRRRSKWRLTERDWNYCAREGRFGAFSMVKRARIVGIDMSDILQESERSTASEPEIAPPEVKEYQRLKLTAKFVGLALNFAALVLLAFLIGPQLEPALRPIVGENAWLQLIVVAALVGILLEILTLPVDYYSSFVLEHRYRLSNQSLAGWVIKRLKGYLVGGPIALPMLLGLYALIWYSGSWWWIWAALGFLAVTLLLGRILPVLILPLFYRMTPLQDASLQQRLEHIAAGTGLTLQGVYRLVLSTETKKANAALTGLGRTRRVLLGDTLLEEFTPEEIEVVFAHEVGHHVHHHLVKMIGWSVVTSAIGFWLVDWLLRSGAPAVGYTSFDHPTALPLVLLVLSVFGLLLAPIHNIVGRFFERQCDQYALDRTGLHGAYRSAFTKLARINKSDPDPNPVIVWLFYDHPPIRQRLALADSRN
jgi:STE24 endopeptidase